ncbi:MAG: hypothetical protein IJO74_06420 [Clostridia bacterium]|nr:hypothetical protein [Clostridia bacterium]
MLENALDVAVILAEVALPEIALPLNVAAVAVQTYRGYADRVLLSKLYKVLNNQDSDFDEWLKLSEKFYKSDKNYKKTVCKLVYTINAINEEELLDIYSNLLRAYKLGLICKQRFFKLTWALSNIYSEDLFELKNIYKEKDMPETCERIALRNVNLLDSYVRTKYGTSISIYNMNEFGFDMLRCGIDFENADKYKRS